MAPKYLPPSGFDVLLILVLASTVAGCGARGKADSGARTLGSGGSGATASVSTGKFDVDATSGEGLLVASSDYRNPIIPGFHPDPSIVGVGDDFYLVTSSFEYFPGVPIFHSRDLVHWRQIGHCLTRASQLPLSSAKSSAGIFAPTLRYHDGTFYLVTTNISSIGNFYVTAKDPAGEWSEPIIVKGDEAGGIDPSLFFDDDGRVYFTRQGEGARGGIFQAEIDIATGRLAAPPTKIWSGTGGVWPEGPHLYKIGQYYYLMIAEGGTSYDHMETIARAPTPMGPFTACPHNPILTHRAEPDSPIQATGHADLVQIKDGSWWMVFLATRPADGAGHHHHLGRETFLAPVTWSADGWPTVNGSRPIALQMSAGALPLERPAARAPSRDDFDASTLAHSWNLLRNPSSTSWSLSARPGFLRLNGTRASLDTVSSPVFVGRRQEHFRAHVAALLDFAPTQDGQQAGLTVRANEDNHYELAVIAVGRAPRVRLQTRIAGATSVVSETSVTARPLTLTVEAYPDHYEFFAEPLGGTRVQLGNAPSTPLSSEVAGGFTGVYFGMYAWTGGGAARMPPADFDWFDYQGLSD